MATDVEVPALGESITEGTLAQWLKKPGEAVAADEPIASLETDKVSVDVPSPIAGVLTEQLVAEGDTVAVGAVIARIDPNAGARRAARGARQDVAAPADGRPTAQGGAGNHRHADDVQRRRHERGDRRAHPLQGPVREEARYSPWLHGFLREGVRPGHTGRSRG